MRLALCLILCLTLVGCGQPDEPAEPVEPETPPLSVESDCYYLGDVTLNSAGGYTGYLSVSDMEVEIHPYFDLSEHINARLIYTSDMDWWRVATATNEKYVSNNYELVQNVDGLVYGFMPVTDSYGMFVYTDTLPIDYVKLYMDKVWISDT